MLKSKRNNAQSKKAKERAKGGKLATTRYLLAASLVGIATQAQAELVGVGLRGESSSQGYRKLSIMGGAELQLKAARGLNPDPEANKFLFESEN